MLGARAHDGFTLIEAIAAVIIIGIVAGLVAPRLLSGTRRAESEVKAFASLLSAAAQRDAIGSERLMVRFEPGEAREGTVPSVGLYVLRWRDDGSRFGSVAWRPDPMVPTLRLNEIEVRQVTLGSVQERGGAWVLEFPETEPRYPLQLELGMKDGDRQSSRWWVSLSSYATAARVFRSEAELRSPAAVTAVDLDGLGMGERAW